MCSSYSSSSFKLHISQNLIESQFRWRQQLSSKLTSNTIRYCSFAYTEENFPCGSSFFFTKETGQSPIIQINMSSSQAFTKKIRAAIKLKIEEFGIDADDELPDYVMVLAANRKEKHQMKTDLQLFLGKHTEIFVEWQVYIDFLQSFLVSGSSKRLTGCRMIPVMRQKRKIAGMRSFYSFIFLPSCDDKVETSSPDVKHRRSPSVEELLPQPARAKSPAPRLRSQVVVVSTRSRVRLLNCSYRSV